MIPGPTAVPEKVLQAMAKQVISHVSEEFAKAFGEALEMTAKLFQTKGHPLILTGSGTLGMEAAISNTVERGDKILCVDNGYFGRRLGEIAETHGAKVEFVEFEWGHHADPSTIRERLEKGGYKALTMVHVDTATGIANPVKEVGEVAKKFDTLFIVDTVCSMGGMDVQVDNWNIDVCLTGSQKAIAAPPGLTLLSFGERALKVIENRKTSVEGYYIDFKRWRPVMEDTRSYFATPSVPIFLALREALELVLKEGLERRHYRHRVIADAMRSGIEAMSLSLFPEEGYRADTLSTINIPDGISDVDLRDKIRKSYNVLCAGGLGKLKGKTIRVGHMGIVTPDDIITTLNSIGASLNKLGHKVNTKSALLAAEEKLDKLRHAKHA